MRDMEERKGGGLLILHKKDSKFQFTKEESTSRDLLLLKGLIGTVKFVVMLAYLRTGNDTETIRYNEIILTELKRKIGGVPDGTAMVILGDFNAHLGYLGQQAENANGRLVQDMIEREDLILLNIDEECRGTYTWRRGEMQSAIDFVMVNDKARGIFSNMTLKC